MKKMILLVSLMLAVPAVSMACPGGGKKGGHFKMMDSDGNGVISADEHAVMAAERFSQMDKDGDGNVSKDEMKAHRKAMKKKWKKDGKKCDMKGGKGDRKMDGSGKGRMGDRES